MKSYVSVSIFLICLLTVSPAVIPQSAGNRGVTFQDILKLPVPPADHRIAYGSDALQFGELRLPGLRKREKRAGRYPVAIIIHGGCWLSAYDLKHVGSLSAALARSGIATWSLEYRRIGDPGGGWPGTFKDVALGTDFLRTLARSYPLDLKRVVTVGHSAGGQLALWLAARRHLPKNSLLYSKNPLPLGGVVSLAGITDLGKYGSLSEQSCNAAVKQLLGGSPGEVAARYKETSPIELLPLRARQRLIHGARDSIVPLELGKDYETAARKSGDDARLIVLEEGGHFELISPESPAWPVVEETVRSLLGVKKPEGR